MKKDLELKQSDVVDKDLLISLGKSPKQANMLLDNVNIKMAFLNKS